MTWIKLDGYDTVYRRFENVFDKVTPIKKLVGETVYNGELYVSRYVETLYGIGNTVKRGIRIETIRMPVGAYDDDWLDGLFIEGKPLEAVMRSAMRYSRRAQRSNVITRGSSYSGPASNAVVSSTDIMAKITNLMGEGK